MYTRANCHSFWPRRNTIYALTKEEERWNNRSNRANRSDRIVLVNYVEYARFVVNSPRNSGLRPREERYWFFARMTLVCGSGFALFGHRLVIDLSCDGLDRRYITDLIYIPQWFINRWRLCTQSPLIKQRYDIISM